MSLSHDPIDTNQDPMEFTMILVPKLIYTNIEV